MSKDSKEMNSSSNSHTFEITRIKYFKEFLKKNHHIKNIIVYKEIY